MYLPQTFSALRDNEFLKSLVVTATLIGAMVGSILFSKCSEHFGRKRALICIQVMYFIFTLLLAASFDLLTLIMARFLVGIAVGGATAVVPLYVAEICPPESRGRIGTAIQFSITAGIIVSYFVGYGFSHVETPWNWRFMFGSAAILPLLPLSLGWFLLESPRWLVKMKRISQARNVLCLLNGVSPISEPSSSRERDAVIGPRQQSVSRRSSSRYSNDQYEEWVYQAQVETELKSMIRTMNETSNGTTSL